MKKILIYYVVLILAWVAAWLFYEKVGLEAQSSSVELAYWTVAKLAIWILPIILVIKFHIKENLIEYLALNNSVRGIKIGVLYGLIFVSLSFLIDIFLRGFSWPSITAGFLSALIIAPIFEEVVFRGFILGSLQKSGTRFWIANTLAALMFLGLHVPGWYFMGSLSSQGIVIFSIVLIGLIAGYAKRKSKSTWGSILFHFVNNLYSAFIK